MIDCLKETTVCYIFVFCFTRCNGWVARKESINRETSDGEGAMKAGMCGSPDGALWEISPGDFVCK